MVRVDGDSGLGSKPDIKRLRRGIIARVLQGSGTIPVPLFTILLAALVVAMCIDDPSWSVGDALGVLLLPSLLTATLWSQRVRLEGSELVRSVLWFDTVRVDLSRSDRVRLEVSEGGKSACRLISIVGAEVVWRQFSLLPLGHRDLLTLNESNYLPKWPTDRQSEWLMAISSQTIDSEVEIIRG